MKYFLDSDYSQDYIRWERKINGEPLSSRLYDASPSGYSQTELGLLQQEIINNQDAAFACFFSLDFPYKHYRMQEVILHKKDPKYAFVFAQHVPFCDIKALQTCVVRSNKIKYITKFACFVKGADRKLLEQLIIRSKNVKCAHMYLKYVKEADVYRFKDVIMRSGKPRYLFELAKHFTKREDVQRIEDLIIASGSFTYLRLFADKIKLADVSRIERSVLDSNNPAEIRKFVQYVRRSTLKPFLLAM